MDNADTPTPSAEEIAAQTFGLESTVSRALGVMPQEVHLRNTKPFSGGRARFLYGSTEPTNEVAGFFKMAQTPDTNLQLNRESVGLTIAHKNRHTHSHNSPSLSVNPRTLWNYPC